MSVLTHTTPATVYVADDNAVVRDALGRLLALEPRFTVHSGDDLEVDGSAIVVDTALLEDLKDVSIGDFIEMIKSLPPAAAGPRRHLRPIPNAADMRDVLSDREMQVVRLVAEGLSNKAISAQLALSDKTVKNHISHILAKLNLSARTQVAVHALRTGIV
ncbi:MAG: response regulator transcription factor [Candidatus Eremiobacteraeota bacterium]|nr:response regulator transcription factor [Candidatus Eremiobacteraeota bacterium]